MSTEQQHLAQAEENKKVIPMTQRIKVRPFFGGPKPEGSNESRIERMVSHHFILEAGTGAIDQTFNELRKEEKGYVYRRGLIKRTRAKIVEQSFGKEPESEHGIYGVSTRWLALHLGALSSFVTKREEWMLVDFGEKTPNPPRTLTVNRPEKPQITRLRVAPIARH